MLGAIIRVTTGVFVLLFRSHFVVRDNSMWPTLRDGDIVHCIPNQLAIRPLRRGDVVVVQFPGIWEKVVIKRVAGLPGEWVSERSDRSLRVEREPSSGGAAAPTELTVAHWICDDDEFFLVGDNAPDSTDSRRYGPIPADAITGRMWLRIPTLSRWGRDR